MDPTRQPASPTGRLANESHFSEKYAQQTDSAQTPYVTVITPQSAVNGVLPGQPTLSHHDDQGKEGALSRQLSQHTPPQPSRYVEMLLQLDKIPSFHNFFASVFTRLLLAGFIVSPATFTSRSNTAKNAASRNQTEQVILNTVQHVPLLWVAAICCLIGAFGISWLWWEWNDNFIWLANRIFLPSLLNAVVGIVNTLINVYTAKDGEWSVSARITAIMTGTCAGASLVLFLVYNNWLLYRVKKDHETKSKGENNVESPAHQEDSF